MAEISPWPRQGPLSDMRPLRLVRPCDASLTLALADLETQLGTIEAYNRLVLAAEALRARIDAGHVKPQNPLYAVDVRGK